MAMKISVIIPAHNAEKYIAQAIESCLDQNPAPHEVLVVDDASTDRTVEIAMRYPPPVRIIRIEQNNGCANARNRGVDEATGNWIALLDADDWFLPGKFEALNRCQQQNPDAKFLYSGFRALEGGRAWDIPAVPPSKLSSLLRYRSPLGVASVVFDRDASRQIGGFDTSYRYAEDWEFFLRFAARFSTRSFACVPETLSVYRIHEGSKSHNTMGIYQARKRIVNGISLHGLSGLSRYLWRRKLNSFLYFDFSIMLREQNLPGDLAFVLRSLLLWPIPSEAIPLRRYKVAAVMILQHLKQPAQKDLAETATVTSHREKHEGACHG